MCVSADVGIRAARDRETRAYREAGWVAEIGRARLVVRRDQTHAVLGVQRRILCARAAAAAAVGEERLPAPVLDHEVQGLLHILNPTQLFAIVVVNHVLRGGHRTLGR